METETLSDEVLMRRVCRRDVDAFRALYGRYEVRVFNLVLRFAGERALAEDLLQETFWRIWQAAHTFDPARGGFRSWLYRVALNATRSEMALKRYSSETRQRRTRTLIKQRITKNGCPFVPCGSSGRDQAPAAVLTGWEDCALGDPLAGARCRRTLDRCQAAMRRKRPQNQGARLTRCRGGNAARSGSG